MWTSSSEVILQLIICSFMKRLAPSLSDAKLGFGMQRYRSVVPVLEDGVYSLLRAKRITPVLEWQHSGVTPSPGWGVQ